MGPLSLPLLYSCTYSYTDYTLRLTRALALRLVLPRLLPCKLQSPIEIKLSYSEKKKKKEWSEPHEIEELSNVPADSVMEDRSDLVFLVIETRKTLLGINDALANLFYKEIGLKAVIPGRRHEEYASLFLQVG